MKPLSFLTAIVTLAITQPALAQLTPSPIGTIKVCTGPLAKQPGSQRVETDGCR